MIYFSKKHFSHFAFWQPMPFPHNQLKVIPCHMFG